MSEIRISTEAVEAVVHKAILDMLDAEQRSLLVENALKYLVTPQTTYNGRAGQSPLQDAFSAALHSVVRRIADKVVASDPEVERKIRALVAGVLTEGMAHNATFSQAVVEALVSKLERHS